MHFNELLMRWRLQGIGGLAALVTTGGVAVQSVPQGPSLYLAVRFGSAVLGCIWIGIAAIDLFYYRRLLHGAVDCLLRLEKSSGGTLDLSTTIEETTKSGGRWMPWVFYALGGSPLIALLWWAWTQSRLLTAP
jgi:hypothetical protein